MKVAWHRSYGVAALITVVIATTSFVAYRNQAFREREQSRARAAAVAISNGAQPLTDLVAGGLIESAVPSKRYSFIRKRRLADGRTLGGPGSPATDKLLYDAANEVERRRGDIVRFLGDHSGRVIAALTTPKGIAVAVTMPPEGPEKFPWLVLFGLLAMGALTAAAGSLVGGRAHSIGLAIGASGLAVPAYLWTGPIPSGLIVASAFGVAIADARGLLSRAGSQFKENRIAYTYLGPAAAAMFVLVATPFIIGLVLGFYNHNHGEWTFVGLENFTQILSGDGRSLSDPLNFWFTLGVTVLWTAMNVLLHVTIGVLLALQLTKGWLRGKGVFRMLLILPWAIPNYITALIWHGMFQSEYGAVNGLLGLVGLDSVSWFSSWATAFTANVTTNTWLGFPFMMVVAIGALETIPKDMYEAAKVDGASPWQRFRHITLPHLRPALLPAVTLGAIWTFNMFNVIYLVSDGSPGGSTDILVTEAYKWAFERGERYGMAAAYATIIFLILLLWTVFGKRIVKRRSE